MIFSYKANTIDRTCQIFDNEGNLLGKLMMRNISNAQQGEQWQVPIKALLPDYPNNTFKVSPNNLEGTIDTNNINKRNTSKSTTPKLNILDYAEKYLTRDEMNTFASLLEKVQQGIAQERAKKQAQVKTVEGMVELVKTGVVTLNSIQPVLDNLGLTLADVGLDEKAE